MAETIELPDVEMPADFEPYAVYDVHLDCIRVLIKDASVTEVRIDECLTVHRDNFPMEGESEYVGFTLKGINHLLHELEMEFDRVYRVSEILNTIVKERPGSIMAVVIALIKGPLAAATACEVEITAQAA